MRSWSCSTVAAKRQGMEWGSPQPSLLPSSPNSSRSPHHGQV
jgi:hypothetical protein